MTYDERRKKALTEWIKECNKCEIEKKQMPTWYSYKLKYDL